MTTAIFFSYMKCVIISHNSNVLKTENTNFFRRLPFYKWFSFVWCCKHQETVVSNSGIRQYMRPGQGPRMQNSFDSMRTLTTSLTISKQSSARPNRVVIIEKPIQL